MYTGIDYRQNASDCFRLAQEIAESAKKQMLVRMARDWFELGRRLRASPVLIHSYSADRTLEP